MKTVFQVTIQIESIDLDDNGEVIEVWDVSDIKELACYDTMQQAEALVDDLLSHVPSEPPPKSGEK